MGVIHRDASSALTGDTSEQKRIRVAVTGGSGAGKTTLLSALAARGYSVVSEVAREVIANRKQRGFSPRPPAAEFAKEIAHRDISQYESAESRSGLVFFDRSLVDSMGMLNALDLLSATEKERWLKRYPYHPEALILPPWQEIYLTDSERDQSFEEAVQVYESLRRWYAECGYRLLEVPPETVDERCDFVLEKLISLAPE